MGSRNGIDHCAGQTFGHKPSEPHVPQAARSFFDGFAVGFGFGSRVDLDVVEGDVELLSQRPREFEVGVGFVATQAVVEVGGMENEAQFPALFRKAA